MIYLLHLSVHLVWRRQHRPRERRLRTGNTWLPFLWEQIRDLKVWAKGVLVAHFIEHVSGSNITFTKGKKKRESKYISYVTEENVILRRKQRSSSIWFQERLLLKLYKKKRNMQRKNTGLMLIYKFIDMTSLKSFNHKIMK